MLYIIKPNFAYFEKALTLGSFSGSYCCDQDHFLLGNFIVQGLHLASVIHNLTKFCIFGEGTHLSDRFLGVTPVTKIISPLGYFVVKVLHFHGNEFIFRYLVTKKFYCSKDVIHN